MEEEVESELWQKDGLMEEVIGSFFFPPVGGIKSSDKDKGSNKSNN